MNIEKATEILKKLNDGYSFKDCEVCENYNETSCQCDKKKCDYLIAIETVLSELEKESKIINLIQEEVRDHIAFENRLKRDRKEPDLFNQGRFYVANNIKNILKKVEDK